MVYAALAAEIGSDARLWMWHGKLVERIIRPIVTGKAHEVSGPRELELLFAASKISGTVFILPFSGESLRGSAACKATSPHRTRSNF
jgi:hypothetical protein